MEHSSLLQFEVAQQTSYFWPELFALRMDLFDLGVLYRDALWVEFLEVFSSVLELSSFDLVSGYTPEVVLD